MSPALSKVNSQLSAFTFIAKPWQNEEVSSNGLPLTPNSISIVGRFQILKSLSHENLTQYLQIERGKHERTIVVSEFYGSPLSTKIEDKNLSLEIILKIFNHCAAGLNFIHKNNIVHHNLEPSNVLIDEWNNAKLYNYGFYYMTNGDANEQYVSFPIGGNIRYLAPERILGNHGNAKSDIWSLGLIICELVLGISLWRNMKFPQIARRILSYSTSNGSVLEKIAREHNSLDAYNNMDEELKSLLVSCLSFSSKDRPTSEEVIKHPIFQTNRNSYAYKVHKKAIIEMSPLERLDITQIFYLWQLAGGDVYSELKKEGLIRSEAPILTIPHLVMLQSQSIPIYKSQSSLFDQRIVMLSMKNLSERLALIPKRAFYPLLHCPRLPYNFGDDMKALPLLIRERNIEYQFYRIVLFARLLKGYPYTRDMIIEEAKIDIPPLLRGKIWAALLNVIKNDQYEKIDKETPTPTDRQIEVDIPRCHQYDELLSSPTGHLKLKRILKAWVNTHPQYVYWQGLDSLTAPFLVTNFNDEETAFLSLINFIPKYLHNFFLKDNSAIIKEYLFKFSQLVTFHEPSLAKHLKSINFIPELFTIPWVLTMFSHVFPLHKIMHLWDKLLIGDSSYPLFIGIAILRQVKATLLDSGFNECILLFSDFPDIVIETCVNDTQRMYEKTPKSVSYRHHVIRHENQEIFDIDNVELSDIHKELSPRISANDLVNLLKISRVFVFDLRPQNDYKRWHIEGSMNLPYTNLILSDRRLEAINIDRNMLKNKVVVVISVNHDNASLFAEFLVDCEVEMVCILHNSVNTLHAILPNNLIGS